MSFQAIDRLRPHAAANIVGAYYAFTNPTISTAIAISSATRTTFLATEAAFLIQNTNPAGGMNLWPDYLTLSCVAAGTAGVASQWAIITDTALRYTSGGTQLTPVSVRTDDSPTFNGAIYFGNITTAAATAARQLARFTSKTAAAPCLAVGDTLTLQFGAPGANGGASASGVATGTAASHTVINVPPVAIGGGHSMLLYFWAASQSAAPTFELCGGVIQR